MHIRRSRRPGVPLRSTQVEKAGLAVGIRGAADKSHEMDEMEVRLDQLQ